MQSRASFDFSRAKSLVDRINACKTQFNNVLEELEREAGNMPEWWDGEAQGAFVDRCRRASSGLASCLEMMEETSRYITKVSNDKNDLETSGKSRFT